MNITVVIVALSLTACILVFFAIMNSETRSSSKGTDNWRKFTVDCFGKEQTTEEYFKNKPECISPMKTVKTCQMRNGKQGCKEELNKFVTNNPNCELTCR